MAEQRPMTEQEQLMVQAIAQSVLADLRYFHPLEPDQGQLEKIAMGIGMDQVFQMAPLLKLFTDSRYTRIGLDISRDSKIIGGANASVRFATPKRLENVEDMNELVSTASITALVMSPSARALLVKQGYKLRFFLPKPDDGDNVVEVDFGKN